MIVLYIYLISGYILSFALYCFVLSSLVVLHLSWIVIFLVNYNL